MQLSEETKTKWSAYVLAQYPNEACAFVVDGNLHTVVNHSTTPTTTFVVDAVDRVIAESKGKVEAFLHSHPYKLDEQTTYEYQAWASSADMRSWIADNIPWGIVATDGEGLSQITWYDDSLEAIEPLEGREFVSGKNDCYGIIRDYYRLELGITLVNGVRGMYWWNNGENLYEDNFRRAGFVEIPAAEATINDIALIRLESPTICHAAVITGPNQILHHCIKRLSGYDTLSKWSRQIVKFIRYEGLNA